MKNIKMKNIENFGQFIKNENSMIKKYFNKGVSHIVYTIDKGWLLKEPINTSSAGLEAFRKHIKFMEIHPNIFPKIRSFNTKNAEIEKLDTKKADSLISHLYLIIQKYFRDLVNTSKTFIVLSIYTSNKHEEIINGLEKLAQANNDIILKKWCDFFKLLDIIFQDYLETEEKAVDLHSENIGVDDEGNIKLIDY